MSDQLEFAFNNFEQAMRLIEHRPKIPKEDVFQAEWLMKAAQTQALFSIAKSLENIERKM